MCIIVFGCDFFAWHFLFLTKKKLKASERKKFCHLYFREWHFTLFFFHHTWINVIHYIFLNNGIKKTGSMQHKIQFYEIEHWTEYNKYIIDIMIQWAQKLFSWLKKPIDACYYKNWTKKKRTVCSNANIDEKWKSKKSEAWMATEWNSSNNNNKTTTKQVVWAIVSIDCMQNFINSDGIKFRTISTKPEHWIERDIMHADTLLWNI